MVISYYVEKSGYEDSDVESASFTLKNHSVNYITGTSDTIVDPQHTIMVIPQSPMELV